MIKKLTILTFLTFMTIQSFSQSYSNSSMIISPFTPFNTSDNYLYHTLKDFNNDGNLDILIDGGMPESQSGSALTTQKALLMLGDGQGHFNFSQYFNKPGSLYNITDFGDFNNDGILDMLMYYYWANGFYLYIGNNSGPLSFNANPQLYSTGTHGGITKFQDYDNDGDLDVISFSSGSASTLTMHVFTNNNGSLTKVSYQVPIIGSDADFGKIHPFFKDFNNDQLLDVYVTVKSNNTLRIDGGALFLQNVNHSFNQIEFDDNLNNIESHIGINFADFNNDGFQDAVIEPYVAINSQHTLKFYYGNPANPLFFNFTSPNSTKTYGFPLSFGATLFGLTGFEIADINNDQKFDLIANFRRPFNPDEFVYITDVFGSNAVMNKIPYTNEVSDLISYQNFGSSIADVNNDGKLDAVVHTDEDNAVRVFLNISNPLGIETQPVTNHFFSISNTISSDFITLNYQDVNEDYFYTIYSLDGKKCKREKISKNLDIHFLNSGLYIITIADKQNRVFLTEKFIKQ